MSDRFLFASTIVTVGLLALGAFGADKVHTASDDYSGRTVTELIDEIRDIDSQSPGINSAAIYDGFIADGSASQFEVGVLGVDKPDVPQLMVELVRRGAAALPDLAAHLTDDTPTKLQVGNAPSGRQVGVDVFMFMYFSDEYDPRTPHWFSRTDPEAMEKKFSGLYNVKVGDVCYVLIGQIVNRRLLAVRYQPSAGLVVNSPIEAPILAERVRSDWANADSENIRQSFLSDIHVHTSKEGISEADDRDKFVYPAFQRLRFYFPETYKQLKGSDRKKRHDFEKYEKSSRENQ